MNNMKILSLQFFAVRFGLKEEELSYGIGIINGEERIPAILIKGKRAFIDVRSDIISPTDIPCVNIRFEPCSLTEGPGGYVFETEGHRVVLSRDSIEKYYATKYFSAATEKYVIGGNI
jgi:hypothetical protein